jgi:GNAT superfamily N-acetyltransferase
VTASRRLSGVEELLDLFGRDAYALAEADPARIASVWAGPGGSVGWVIPSRRVVGRAHVVALGTGADAGADAAALALAVAAEDGIDLGSVTLPRDADRLLRPSYLLDPRNDWEWFATWAAPPLQPREDQVGWLDATRDAVAIRDLLRSSARHDVDPGDPHARRWCGVWAPDGTLCAAAAHTENRRGVPVLASIATRGDVRGQGYGAAVTAWLTRQLLGEGSGWVTLGMYSDNDVARRLYLRLGYRCEHRFTSGRLVQNRPLRK